MYASNLEWLKSALFVNFAILHVYFKVTRGGEGGGLIDVSQQASSGLGPFQNGHHTWLRFQCPEKATIPSQGGRFNLGAKFFNLRATHLAQAC